MKFDVVVAGVGGQGVLLVANAVAAAAARQGLTVKQGEIHGMSQRGGAVQANLRLSDGPVTSDLVPRGGASLILAVEPVEALRYVDYLAPEGHVVTSVDPFDNIDDYPPMEEVLAALRRLPRVITVEADRLSRQAGSGKAGNVVVLGAAARLLPMPPDVLLDAVLEAVAPLGPKVVEANRKAFGLGMEAAAAQPVPA